MALEEAGYTAEIILDGQAAMDRLKQTAPELIILDLHLPHVSGQEILGYIHSTAHLSNVRIIILSADPVLTDYLRDQADLVLVKPVGFYQLRELSLRMRPDAMS
jgi:DNA-binding response OmpR family regulator